MVGKRQGERLPGSSAPPLRIAALLFGSGLAALVYQTAWQRQFHLVFGASSAASSAVLGIFLGGLGFGGLYFGRRVERSDKPLAYYANLELGIALSAAVSPLLLLGASHLYVASGGSLALGTWGATALRLATAALVMGGPVFLMGGTLPAAARAVETVDDQARSRVALLYGLNTCGAVAGALLGTFLLFERFGTAASLWLAAALNLVVALAARALGHRAPPVPITDGEGSPPSSGDVPLATLEPQRLRSALAFVAAAVAGFGFLLLELVWYRLLAPILGGSTFTFGLILAAALAGIGLGGYAYSRRRRDQPATLVLLATTTALEALCVIVPFAMGDTIAIYAALTRELGNWGFASLVGSWTSITLLVVFPAAAVSGYQFPLLFALLGRGRRNVAEQIGRLYAVNTLGAIVGALLGGFVLIPLLGATTCWKLVAIAFALTALAAAGSAMASHLRHARGVPWAIALVSATLVLSSSIGPTAAWRHAPIGAGRAKIHKRDKNQLEAWRRHRNNQIVWERDGVETAVGVMNTDGIAFLINGKADGSAFGDRGTQTMLGMLPAMLHPAPKSAFVVGLGTGMTAGWLAKIDGMQRVDVAELEPAIGEVAKMASAMNHDVMNQPNVHVHYGDGRELMLTTSTRYDVIVSEPSNPYRIGISTLFTREFYGVVRSKLHDGGIFAQWVQGYEIDAQSIRSIIATLRTQFSFVETWQTQGSDLLFMASEKPRSYDVDALRAKLEREPYRTALRRMWLVQDAEGVLSHFVAAAPLVEEIGKFQSPPINTDEKNTLEYAFARSVGSKTQPATLRLLIHAGKRGLHRPTTKGNVDWERVDELRHRSWLISEKGVPNIPLPKNARERLAAFTAACTGKLDDVMTYWDAQTNAQPRDDMELFAVALGNAFRGFADAYIHVGELRERGYVAEADLALGHLASRSGFRGRALGHYLEGLDALRGGEIPLCNTAEQLLSSILKIGEKDPNIARAALAGLAKGPLLAHVAEGWRISAIHQLGFAQMSGDGADPRLCVITLDRQLEQPVWERSFLENRAECLERARHPLAASARADLARYLAATSGKLFDDSRDVPALPPPSPTQPPASSSANANVSRSAAPAASDDAAPAHAGPRADP